MILLNQRATYFILIKNNNPEFQGGDKVGENYTTLTSFQDQQEQLNYRTIIMNKQINTS